VPATYANVTLLGADTPDVVAALGPGPALVTEAIAGMTVVFAAADEEAARFGEGLTAAALSAACGCDALEVAVFEDAGAAGASPAIDLLQYRLYRRGVEVDLGVVATAAALQLAEQAGGTLPAADGARLVDRLGRGDAALAARALSPGEPLGGASERHVWLVEALDLPRCAAGWGYRYLAAYPEGFDGGPLTVVGRTEPQKNETPEE
jgi:hypothetical protein